MQRRESWLDAAIFVDLFYLSDHIIFISLKIFHHILLYCSPYSLLDL